MTGNETCRNCIYCIPDVPLEKGFTYACARDGFKEYDPEMGICISIKEPVEKPEECEHFEEIPKEYLKSSESAY